MEKEFGIWALGIAFTVGSVGGIIAAPGVAYFGAGIDGNAP